MAELKVEPSSNCKTTSGAAGPGCAAAVSGTDAAGRVVPACPDPDPHAAAANIKPVSAAKPRRGFIPPG